MTELTDADFITPPPPWGYDKVVVVRPAEYDIETTIAHVREMLDNPIDSVFPLAGSGAADDLREALTDRAGYHAPKLLWVRCKRAWCSTDRIAMWMVVVASNGVRHAQLRCIACCCLDRTSGADAVGVSWPVIRNYADRAPECERCGSTNGTEQHHWAPKHLFDDYHYWPTSHLCRSCHMKWHSIVTPNMALRRTA